MTSYLIGQPYSKDFLVRVLFLSEPDAFKARFPIKTVVNLQPSSQLAINIRCDMSFTKKRKISEMDRPVDSFNETTPKSTPTPDPGCAEDENSTRNSGNDTIPDDGNTANADTIETNHDERMERFKALQLRAVSSL